MMNERIKKLAEQAGMVYHCEHQYDGFNEQKFAELIVRECLEQIYSMTIDNPTDDWDQGYDSGLHQAAATIKEHLGVEDFAAELLGSNDKTDIVKNWRNNT